MADKLVNRVSFRDSDHTYTLDGQNLPAVSKVLDNLSKPLAHWAAKMGAQAADEFLRDRITTHEGIYRGAWVPEGEIHSLFNTVQYAYADVRNKAGNKGTSVHSAINQFHTKYFEAVAPTEPDEQEAWSAYLEWWHKSEFKVIDAERKIVCPKGNYAGRLDLVLKDKNSDVYICDIKTSNGIYTSSILQNAAYAHAYESEGEHIVSGTKVLWLPKGCTKLTVIERDRKEWRRDYNIFNALVKVHSYRKGMDAFMKEVNEEHKPQPVEAEA